MSEKLVRSREYLSQNRRSIIGRSLAAAIAGAAMETGVGYLAVAITSVLASGAAQALVTKVGLDVDHLKLQRVRALLSKGDVAEGCSAVVSTSLRSRLIVPARSTVSGTSAS